MTSIPQGHKERSYLDRVQGLEEAYPALANFVEKMKDPKDEDRNLVQRSHVERFGRLPGRCALLTFLDGTVQHREFLAPKELEAHFQLLRADSEIETARRLFILEDLEPAWVNVLGTHLCVNPLVFAEQMNTWNFTDSHTIPACILPSTVNPSTSFTLKYYEIRALSGTPVDWMRNQATFAVNRRRYESWRDIDTKSFTNKWRHALVRRCASFWTNEQHRKKGWDAVILVDPAFDSFPYKEPRHAQANGFETPLATATTSTTTTAHTILQDPQTYTSLTSLWGSREWMQRKFLQSGCDTSGPYHGGSTTLGPITSTTLAKAPTPYSLSCPLSFLVHHWTTIAPTALISQISNSAVNCAHPLLKYVASLWTSQLDLVEFGVAQSEYFADDHQASIGFDTSGGAWRRELMEITESTKDVNYMGRLLNHFERGLKLNLTALGVVLGAEAIDAAAPEAIRGAQMDFISIRARLTPFRERVTGLSSIVNELTSQQTAFKSIKDGDFGMRLSLLGSVIFPMTLVASLMSMGDDFLAGKSQFWVFWAVSIPVVLILASVLVFGRTPEHRRKQWVREAKLILRSNLSI